MCLVVHGTHCCLMYELLSKILDGGFCMLQSRREFLISSFFQLLPQRVCAFTCDAPFLISVLCSICIWHCLITATSISGSGELLSGYVAKHFFPPKYSGQEIWAENYWPFRNRDIYSTLSLTKGE